MSKEAYIFEVNQKSFEQYALLNSHKTPVIAEFMGAWSGPCILLSDILSRLAKEFPEEFIFAKVDIDEQPELRTQYKIENVPSLIIFKDGKAIRTEVGQLEETEVRGLLKDLGIIHVSDLLREQARDEHLAGNTTEAILLLTEAIQKSPSNIRVAMDMVQVFLDIGELEQAEGLLGRLPEQVQQTDTGKLLAGQLSFAKLAHKTAGKQALSSELLHSSDDAKSSDIRFDLAICLIAEHDCETASKHLFDILKVDQDYKQGAARELVITLSNMLSTTSPDLSQSLRKKLSNFLSS